MKQCAKRRTYTRHCNNEQELSECKGSNGKYSRAWHCDNEDEPRCSKRIYRGFHFSIKLSASLFHRNRIAFPSFNTVPTCIMNARCACFAVHSVPADRPAAQRPSQTARGRTVSRAAPPVTPSDETLDRHRVCARCHGQHRPNRVKNVIRASPGRGPFSSSPGPIVVSVLTVTADRQLIQLRWVQRNDDNA